MESPTPSFMSTTGASIKSTNSTTNTTTNNPPPKECDYDVNPTFLYQAVEAKQWQHVLDFIEQNETAASQCSTWVIRKESDGKLRWRLLPLHAAVIFGSPLSIITSLLQEYPQAAQQKDDQGMLPLHLCFRNFTDWNIVEELLTAYPQGILIKDRKGRTPLQCACSAFRKPASVMELYTHVALTQERHVLQKQHATTLQAKIQALQTTHVSTLERLKHDVMVQNQEMEQELLTTQTQYQTLEQEYSLLKQEYQTKCLLETELTTKLRQVTEALDELTLIEQEYKQEQESILEKENAVLQTIIQDLLQSHESLEKRLDECIQREQEEKMAYIQKLQALLQQQQQEQEQSGVSTAFTSLQRDVQLTTINVKNQLSSLSLWNTVNKKHEKEKQDSEVVDDSAAEDTESIQQQQQQAEETSREEKAPMTGDDFEDALSHDVE